YAGLPRRSRPPRRRSGPAPRRRRRPAAATRQGVPIRSLIEVTPPRERAILVAAPRKGTPDAQLMDEHLAELTRLVDTAGAEVVGQLHQQVVSQRAATLIGEGKVEELARLIFDTKATLVVF